MAKLRWAITCARVITDQSTNLVSYIDAVEELQMPALPAGAPPFTVGTTWERETNDVTIHVRVRILAPDGSSLGEIRADLEPQDGIRRHRANFTFMLVLRAVGVHRVVVEQLSHEEWREEWSIPLEARVIELPPLSEPELAPQPVASPATSPSRVKQRRKAK